MDECETWEELEDLLARFIMWCAEDMPGYDYRQKKPMVSAHLARSTTTSHPACISPPQHHASPPRRLLGR